MEADKCVTRLQLDALKLPLQPLEGVVYQRLRDACFPAQLRLKLYERLNVFIRQLILTVLVEVTLV